MSDAVRKRTTEEISEDIGRTRLGLGFIVEALEGRLSMGSLIDEAMGMLRGRDRAGGEAPIGALIKEHPGPAALITAGVVWLAVENRKDAEKGKRGTTKRAASKSSASGSKTAAKSASKSARKSSSRKKSTGE
jgi:hypothetical protein